jgi:hypothetical protein
MREFKYLQNINYKSRRKQSMNTLGEGRTSHALGWRESIL